MPFSDTSNIPWFTEVMTSLKPRTVLDVGPGFGKYGRIIKSEFPTTTVDAVEVWPTYIEKYALPDFYRNIQIKDVRLVESFDYDMVILGDILEHMSEVEAMTLWEKIIRDSGSAVISIPIIKYPQGEEEGNPYEVHVVEDWTHEKVLQAFRGITEYKLFKVTGSYLAIFKEWDV